MTYPEPSFSVDVDVTNPGHFFACCGLLELAHRLWPGAEAWFHAKNRRFAVQVGDAEPSLRLLIHSLKECTVAGLTQQESDEQRALEQERRDHGKTFLAEKEQRRQELGEQAREGTLRIAEPVGLLLDWWKSDEATVKTWAGRQEIHKIARAAQDALPGINDPTPLFDYGCIMRMPEEYCKGKLGRKKPVAPFYFDARRFAHPLHAGFSLDVLEAETTAHPAVELLSLIGLQRFRPRPAPVKWSFDYWVWSRPLGAPVAAGVASGSVPAPDREGYRFPLRFRDDQKRYKAFGWATTIGDHK
ncbi:MAG TPA: type I-U CRISPR-associated protein Cas8c [Dehalococcoidia bacterium]|jgi:CRISPR-associated protein Csb3|nr:type I-U CRISPR-associated protein Cas8c [Dehalococcoidia bacterium]